MGVSSKSLKVTTEVPPAAVHLRDGPPLQQTVPWGAGAIDYPPADLNSRPRNLEQISCFLLKMSSYSPSAPGIWRYNITFSLDPIKHQQKFTNIMMKFPPDMPPVEIKLLTSFTWCEDAVAFRHFGQW